MKKYITYEQPFERRIFNENQLHEVYRDMVDKNEYSTFEIWKSDMLKSGVFEIISK